MKKQLLLFLTSMCVVAGIYAQPTITNVSGTVAHGQSITLSGSGFGIKSQAAPLIWDDFENGTIGSLVANGWEPQRDNETHPIYTDVQKYGLGNLSLTNHVEANSNNAPGCEFCGAYQEVEESYELYTSYRFRYDVIGNNNSVMKLARLASTPNYGGVDNYNGVGTFKYQYQPMVDWGYINLEHSSDANIQQTCTGVPGGEWHRVEMYYKLSQPAGAANGEAWIVIDNEQNTRFKIKDIVTLDEGYTSKLHSLLLPLMLANPKEDGKWDLYVDDVYLDNSLARVELGNASTWSSSTHKEILIPTSWSSNAITVTVNSGMFSNQEQAYLYVVDANGAVNSAGYPVIVDVTTHAITTSAGIGGSITPNDTVQVAQSTDQNFIITADTGYKISDVTVDNISQGAISSYTFTDVQTNHTISASFSAEKNLALNKSVTVSGEPEPENPGTSAVDGTVATRWAGSGGYPQWIEVDLGEIYNIHATEVVCFNDRDYQFTIDIKTTAGGTYTQIVDRSGNTQGGSEVSPIRDDFTEIQGRYVRITVTGAYQYGSTWTSLNEFRVFGSIHTIMASAGANGSITPSDSVQVIQGSNQSFTITADSGYEISDVTVDNVSQGAVSSYTFTDVQANHTISASFTAIDSDIIIGISGTEPENPKEDLRVFFSTYGLEVYYGSSLAPEDNGNALVGVYNMRGQLIQQIPTKVGSLRAGVICNSSQWNEGLYIVRVLTTNANRSTKVMLIRR